MEKKRTGLSHDELQAAIDRESEQFKEHYLWLENHMPPSFFEEIDRENVLLITHNLMRFSLQDHFSLIYLKNSAIVICLDTPISDLTVLKNFGKHGIRYYRTFVSNAPSPSTDVESKLKIAMIHFTEAYVNPDKDSSSMQKEEFFSLIQMQNPDINKEEFEKILSGMDSRFLKSMTTERLSIALNLFFRARARDHCQYEVLYNEKWKENNNPSMRIVLAWRNVPKYRFLYRLAQTIFRHKLNLQRVSATYVDPHSTNNVIIMSIAIHGQKQEAAWEAADIPDFLRELATLKYFESFDIIDKVFEQPALLSGNMANLLRSIISFVHQILVHSDPNIYSLSNIEEGFCRHPELTVKICEIFEKKFNPEAHNLQQCNSAKKELLALVNALDTGHTINDTRRKNILLQGINFVDNLLKTNFYRKVKTAFAFRLDPYLLEKVPYSRKEKFPELPYGIFFFRGMKYIAFHIRFKDLARGGLRTVTPEKAEQFFSERNNVFLECYNLSYTQQKKNKDIPEGGSKAVILLEPFDRSLHEMDIFRRELKAAGVPQEEIDLQLKTFRKSHKLELLHQSQKSFVNSLLTLVNCFDDGRLKAKHIIDYWKRCEHIYLGPDENMHNEIIEWIASHSEKHGYASGKSFISSKPSLGINHKEFGVTSLGVNVYMEEVLLYLGINPQKDSFTVKISGGPDGDVAGNQILNLYKFYPNTAKLIALTDISGTIYDPEGLDLKEMVNLFHSSLPIRNYPQEKLHEGGFLLDLATRREQSAFSWQTLLWKKESNVLIKNWISGSDMHHLFRNNVHQARTDVFIPAGGRPKTLNETNYTDFLDDSGNPTSKAIVEGANLYLTQDARRKLEELGVIIIKDSSCNKGGVICSSFEVLSFLTLEKDLFLKEKEQLVAQILQIIKKTAKNEAKLLLHSYKKQEGYLTDISEWVSDKINTYKYQLLDYLETIELSNNMKDPLIRCLLIYCPEVLSEKYGKRILQNIPDIHKKAIIASYIAASLVYNRGLHWSPSIVDVLPLISRDPNIIEPKKNI